MDTKKQYEKKLKKLLKNEKTDINKIDDLMLETLEKCQQDLLKSTEDILMKNINERKIIIKKNKNGKKEDLNSKI